MEYFKLSAPRNTMVSVMSLLLMVIAATATVSEAQLLRNGACPNVTSMPNFNISMFMGTWYEQIHTKRWAGLDLECNTQTFTMNTNNNYSYDSFMYSPTVDRVFYEYGDVIVRPLGPQNKKNNYLLDLMGDDPMNYIFLLGTDYKSFATLWTCTPTGDDLHFENVVILTREKKAKVPSLVYGLKCLDSFNITRQYLSYTKQKKCPDFNINVILGNSTVPAVPVTPSVQVSMGTTPSSISGAPTNVTAQTTSGSPTSTVVMPMSTPSG